MTHSSSAPTSIERSIALRRRRDLVIEPVVARGKRYWHIKDPLSLRYWQFGAEEMFLWEQLDGSISLFEWQSRFQRRFEPHRIEFAQLHDFLAMLHREGLVWTDAAGQADVLLARRVERQTKSFWKSASNVLAIRFRGLNPEPFLKRMYPAVSWLFHPMTVLLVGLFAVSALILLLVEWSQFVARLPDTQSFFSASGLVWLAIALAITKVLHELGHAFACKHFGGECHELGVMLLVFTPCLYCNVSDTWLLPDKWRRMAVSSAGMYVEFLLASVATWMWWLSQPGMFNSLCLSVMVVCSVGTFLFNANPLLRYDGYFILSDWLETPNLAAESNTAVRRFFARVCLGVDEKMSAAGGASRNNHWLVPYGIASGIYRLLVVGLVLWYFHQVLAAQRLEAFSVLLAAVVVAGMIWPLAKGIWNFFRQPGRIAQAIEGQNVRRRNVVATIAVLASLLAAACFVPVRHTIRAPATIRPADATAVYVTVQGTLISCLAPGTVVNQGDTIATLRNDELDFEIARLTGERNVLRRQLESLQRQRVDDLRTGIGGSSGQSSVIKQSLADAETQLEQRLEDSKRLIITAPNDGVVLAPPLQSDAHDADELPGWSGTPLDPPNIGCFFDTGTLLCHVGPPGKREAIVIVDQALVEELASGAGALVRLEELPDVTLRGRLADISAISRHTAPRDQVTQQDKPVTAKRDEFQLTGTFYEVLVTLSDDSSIPYGATGVAKIHAAPQSLARQFYNWFCRTFRFV